MGVGRARSVDEKIRGLSSVIWGLVWVGAFPGGLSFLKFPCPALLLDATSRWPDGSSLLLFHPTLGDTLGHFP